MFSDYVQRFTLDMWRICTLNILAVFYMDQAIKNMLLLMDLLFLCDSFTFIFVCFQCFYLFIF
jgi:hypothetical protein